MKSSVLETEYFYNSRFTFYGDVLFFEYELEDFGNPNRLATLTFFLVDGDDAFVSVDCRHRYRHGTTYSRWIRNYEMNNQQVRAGSVSEFVTSCRAFCECYINEEEFDDVALLAASVIDSCNE